MSAEYWTPEFEVATLQAPQTELKAKLGGLPWGFPVARWPQCGDCGVAMTLVGQLPHQPKVLELDSGDGVLHVFQCENDPGICDYGVQDSGANAAMILRHNELSEGLTPKPDGVWQLPEAWIIGWNKHPLPKEVLEYADRWYDPELLSYLPESVFAAQLRDDNRAGGLPSWTGSGPVGYPEPPFEFLAQFGAHLWFDKPLPPVKGQDEMNHHAWKERYPNAFWHLAQNGGGQYYSEWANFGGGGTGYLFSDRTVRTPQVSWFWNT